MVQCSNCSVAVEENANFCQLCGEPLIKNTADIPAFTKSGRLRREELIFTDFQKLSKFQKRKIFWKISGLILISSIIITLLIDFISNRNITWSRFPATLSLILLINFTLNTFLHRKILLMMVLSFLSMVLLFILFDIYIPGSGWKLHLGIPVTMLVYLTFYSLIYLIGNARQKGMNIIAYSLLAAGLLCIAAEGIISVYSLGRLYFEWSLIVMVSVLFIAVILLYIHYRLKKATDLKRFFHI
jgi:hypothetical protein